MPTFEYIALDRAGKQSRGTLAAESASAARRQLRDRRLHATKLRPVSELAGQGGFSLGNIFRGKRRRLVLEFTRQLATMIQAEVKLTEALGVLISQAEDEKFSPIIQNIRDQVLSGETLADGLKEYPGWFDSIYVAMVKVGEVTGNLGRSLQLLGDYMGKSQRLEAKVKSALMYPLILICISLLVIVLLMTVIVPKITKIIVQSGKEIPGITQFLMDFSDLLVGYWWLFILGGVGLAWLVRQTLSRPAGRLAFDRFNLRLPVIGELIRQTIVARFTSTLSALIRSGMPMADSLQVVSEVTGNSVMAHAVRLARERIIAGADIATPLRESNVIGPAVAHMITVGERTGELEAMLLTIAASIEEDTDITVQRISSTIEPIIIVFIAVIVGFICIATLMPILQVANLSGA